MTELPLNESITELQHRNIYKRGFLKNKSKKISLFALRRIESSCCWVPVFNRKQLVE